MTSNFLDNTCTKIQNMAFKTSQMDQIALEYWYYGSLGRLRVDGRGFLHQTPILKKLSAREKSSCRTCAEACHSHFKKAAKGTICPLQNLEEKTQKEAHTKRFSSVQKLQAKTEHGKYIYFIILKSRFSHAVLNTYISCSNQAWWTCLAIVNMSHRKRAWTLESFVTPNQSHSESEKNDTDEEQCIN